MPSGPAATTEMVATATATTTPVTITATRRTAERRARSDMPGLHATGPGKWLLVVALFAGLVWQLLFAWQVLRSDPRFFSAQRDVVFWGADGRRPTPEQVMRVAQAIDSSVAAWP